MTDDKARDKKAAEEPHLGAPFVVEIGSLDDEKVKVTAQFNPKELQVDKNVPWTKKEKTFAEQVQLEFTGAEARTLSMELLFDEFETGASVQPTIDTLLKLATIREDPAGKAKEPQKRPHHVVVTWGYGEGKAAQESDSKKTELKSAGKLLPFKGVIASVQTKYTMFTAGGVPVRATCNVKFTEADKLSFKKK